MPRPLPCYIIGGMATETTEYCDICGEDTRYLSFRGGTRVYRGHFKEGGWFWKGREDEPLKGTVAICSECWRAVGRAVREAREARTTEAVA